MEGAVTRTLALLAVAGAAALTASRCVPEAHACPPGLADPSHETLQLPAGCPAPFEGRLVTLPAWERIRADLAAADIVIPYLEAEVARARAERDGALRQVEESAAHGAEVIDRLADAVAAIPEEKPRAGWPWAAVGASSLGLALLACEAAECGGLETGAAAAVGVAVPLVIAWWMD